MADANRDLMFGLIALQVGLIDQGRLVAAFQSWIRDRSRPLADHLAARGDLDAEGVAAVEAMAALHLKKHEGDAEKSLASIPVGRSTREELVGLGDPGLTHLASRVGVASAPTEADGDRTATYSVGLESGDGRRFRILRPHARGGLGAVFVALDSELHREVALKQILDSHADDPTSRQRFLLEAEVTGGLEHPGIVPVYGLGAHDDGRPYYAMRFIRGDSLKEAVEKFHADASLKKDAGRRSLEFRKLLRRFLDVCNAIDYAHSRGVLHRDLKPGNIIVGKHGETLVVDWGLAKASGRRDVDADAAERPLTPSSASGSAETLPGSAIGTPAYMSPEQARGDLDSLGPASDVYSLGATLYCILTGRPPFEGDDVGAILRGVATGSFPTPRAVDPTLDRALEAVCLKAMSTRPEDRYGKVRSLAEDVERWAADEPVAAYRDPPLRKAGRWARRHRPLVAGAAALLASSVVGLAVGALLINQERARAESNFRRARAAVDEYFTTVSESKLLNVPGLQPLRKELLESARRYYEDFLNERGEDPGVAAEAAAAAFRVASVTALLGDLAGASEHYRRAIALYETLVASRPGDVDLRSDLSMCYSSLGLLLDGMERDDEGVVEVRRALEIRERLAREHPENGHFQADLARSHRHLGDFHRQVGEFAQAEEHWRKGLAIQEDLLAHPPPRDPTRHHLTRRGDVETIVREDLADILFDLSGILRELGRWDESLVFGRRGRDLLEAMLRDRPGDAELMAQLAGGYTNLALTTLNRGSAEGSHELGAKAIALLEKVVAANPSVENYRGRLADAHLTSGYALERLGRAESATREYRLATELAEGLLASDATSVFAMSLTAQGLLYQSRMLINAGRLDDALPKLRRAQALQEEIVRRHPKVVFYRFNLAFVCRALGRAEERYGRPADAFSAFDRARRLDAIEADQIFIGRYNEACDEALMARVAPPERREALVGQALATLRRAVAQGYRSYAELANDADLSELRGRPELDLLLLDLAFPDDPFSGAP